MLQEQGVDGAKVSDYGKRQKLEKHASQKVFLFDIEGTTTPISFVKETLFPYAHAKVKDFLRDTWESAETQNDVQKLLAQIENDFISGIKMPLTRDDISVQEIPDRIDVISKYVQWNIVEDRKVSALKQLQGHMWKDGYESQKFTSLVYEDVPSFFREVVKSGARVAIYSSGSREAQHLLFKYSDRGDLRQYISCYFDTFVGGKRESQSYSQIRLFLGVDTPSDIVFVTDILEEAEAALQAGFSAVISQRPGNLPTKAHSLRIVNSFEELMDLVVAIQ